MTYRIITAEEFNDLYRYSSYVTIAEEQDLFYQVYFNQDRKCYIAVPAEGSFICIKYANNGKMIIDLQALFPCSAADFKKVLSALDTAYNADDIAYQLHKYFYDRFNAADENRNNTKYLPDQARYTAEMKKYISLNDTLRKYYNVPAFSDEKAAVKFKSASVYAIGTEGIKAFQGYKFNYKGYEFSVYQQSKNYHSVLLSSCGLQVCTAGSRKEIIPSLDRVIDKLETALKSDNYPVYVENFNKAMAAAGYAEEKTEEKKEAKKEQRKTAEQKTAAKKTAAKKTEEKKTEEKKDPADISEEKKDHLQENCSINLPVLSDEYYKIYSLLYNNRDSYNNMSSYAGMEKFNKLFVTDYEYPGNNPFMNAVYSFVRYRQDILSSDREQAAFYYAYCNLSGIPEKDNVMQEKDPADDQVENIPDQQETMILQYNTYQFDEKEHILYPVYYSFTYDYCFSADDPYEKKGRHIIGNSENGCKLITDTWIEKYLLPMNSEAAEHTKKMYREGLLTYDEQIYQLLSLWYSLRIIEKEKSDMEKRKEQKTILQKAFSIKDEYTEQIRQKYVKGYLSYDELEIMQLLHYIEYTEKEEKEAAAFSRFDAFTDQLKRWYQRGSITYDELKKELITYHENCLQQELKEKDLQAIAMEKINSMHGYDDLYNDTKKAIYDYILHNLQEAAVISEENVPAYEKVIQADEGNVPAADIIPADDIRSIALKKCYSIPGYKDLPLSEKNAVYGRTVLEIEYGKEVSEKVYGNPAACSIAAMEYAESSAHAVKLGQTAESDCAAAAYASIDRAGKTQYIAVQSRVKRFEKKRTVIPERIHSILLPAEHAIQINDTS